MVEKVTIATVAQRARVSRQTVSNVLNSPQIVREETRLRVEEAIAALGYRANQAARQMRTGRSHLLAVRIEPTRDGINGSVLDRFLHGLTFAAAAAGYRVMLYTADGDGDEIKTFDDLLASYDLDGFVLTGTDHGDVRTFWLAEHGVPFVTFGRPWDEPERHSWVDVDNADGTAQATRRLIETGHRRIGFIGWPAGSGVGDDRRDGWQRTMKAHDLDPAGLDRGTDDGIPQGAECARDLLTMPDAPTAFVCASDSLALGALQAAGGRSAVTGFDDTPVAQAVGLTSVSQPLPEAAARCIDLLTNHLDGDPVGTTQVLLQPSLMVRTTA
ncbi:LacI family transcriptional regulator [Asanoa ferruginea]|uniref:LacI family transcriptional regulator n=1 Tax=Asanoa ferruginea TaxID=53367 RepID=A0A3D9ZL36_9ACTN|nr:LacI family DNA-binding transcriptional regulator [Asanoa ferruginea]REF97917.1 LacI family transcriptional regulator [Asanoa ferruginea]GIF50057.1 LacI family transcriptional regulator [Asanoa ferruginea]